MDNILAFAPRSAPARHPALHHLAVPDDYVRTSAQAGAEGEARARCIRAAGTLARACASWSKALVHSPSPEGEALLAGAKLLVADLLLLGGAETSLPGGGDLSRAAEDLAARIRQLHERFGVLGALQPAPTP